MAIIGNPITKSGGGKKSAAIQVTYPEGSICTCSNGIKTLTAENTSGRYTFYIPKVILPSTWTVECHNGNNNDSKTVTINTKGDLLIVTLNYFSSILNDNSWEKISQAAQGGFGDTYWDIGDCKQIVLNGAIGGYLTLDNYTTYVFILDFNHPINKTIADNNIIFGGFKTSLTAGKDIALCDSKLMYSRTSIAFSINHAYFIQEHWSGRTYDANYGYGGWKACDLRYDILGAVESAPQQYNTLKTTSSAGYDASTAAITSPKNNTLMAALPSDFRNVLRLHQHYTDNKGNSGNVDANITSVIDAGIFLLSEFEVLGSRSYANSYEQNHQKQMSYYANGNSKIKYRHDNVSSSLRYWTSSARYSGSEFIYISTSSASEFEYSCYSFGLAPAFKV